MVKKGKKKRAKKRTRRLVTPRNRLASMVTAMRQMGEKLGRMDDYQVIRLDQEYKGVVVTYALAPKKIHFEASNWKCSFVIRVLFGREVKRLVCSFEAGQVEIVG